MSRSTELALRYSEDHGFALLPLQPGGKEPNFPVLNDVYGSAQWASLRVRPASAPEILEWYRIDPDTNLGIITGHASGGLVVLDFDRRPTIRLPETPIVSTGRGLHVYARGTTRIATTRTINGFEVKGEGSYVVAPPSVHTSGEPYHWLIAPTGLGSLFLPEADLRDVTDVPIDDAVLLPRLKGEQATPLGVDLYSYGLESDGQPAELSDWDRSDAFVCAVSRRVGIPDVPLGKSFRCVLPGHVDQRPSASLYREPRRGSVVYHDWHRGDRFFWLAEVYAAISSGQVRKLSNAELGTWKRRLLIELAFKKPIEVDLPALPDNAPGDVVVWFRGFALRLACCGSERWLARGVPFTPDFVERWCGLPADRAVKAKKWLVKHKLLDRVGKAGLCGLWLPADVKPASKGGRP